MESWGSADEGRQEESSRCEAGGGWPQAWSVYCVKDNSNSSDFPDLPVTQDWVPLWEGLFLPFNPHTSLLL